LAEPTLIGPHLGSTPADLKRSRSHTRAIPDDLLREASRRLGALSLLGAVLWIVAPGLGHVAARVTNPATPWVDFGALDVIAVVSVVVSLALFAYTRRHDSDPKFVVDLGLAYMVYIGLACGLAFHWGPPSSPRMQPEISWVGAVVLMFAAMLPNAPRKMLIAGLIAVSMMPLGMLLAKARGTWEFGPPVNALVMHYPDFLLVGVAVVISHVVMNLGRQVTKAREMGSYRLGELLGRGGMGEVYKASHRMLARPAAIKLIRPEVLTGQHDEMAQLARTRFRREAEAAASLRSPHTVQLYDFGVTDDGTFYFVMELLEGMDLESLVSHHGPQPPARVIYILRQVCESLAEAHALGLAHRDVKPENIHLGQVGLRHDFVKVLDFGLVKAVVEKAERQTMATSAGLAPGTPAYMAPEMALGEAVDGRADLYALGCVAYYLLTADLVFRAENALQLLAKHLNSDPVAPSQRTEAEIPPALDRLVLACLSKDPAARPQTASAVDQMLAAIPIAPWDEEHAARWWSALALASVPATVSAPALVPNEFPVA
jgi:tRNA A-37 threonylcarbamoyl transferase component Bud32